MSYSTLAKKSLKLKEEKSELKGKIDINKAALDSYFKLAGETANEETFSGRDKLSKLISSHKQKMVKYDSSMNKIQQKQEKLKATILYKGNRACLSGQNILSLVDDEQQQETINGGQPTTAKGKPLHCNFQSLIRNFMKPNESKKKLKLKNPESAEESTGSVNENPSQSSNGDSSEMQVNAIAVVPASNGDSSEMQVNAIAVVPASNGDSSEMQVNAIAVVPASNGDSSEMQVNAIAVVQASNGDSSEMQVNAIAVVPASNGDSLQVPTSLSPDVIESNVNLDVLQPNATLETQDYLSDFELQHRYS